MALAEDSMQAPSAGRRLLNWAGALLLVVLAVMTALWLKNWVGQDMPPKRQVARITVLPDTPPPPPPPPKAEQKPPPRDEQPPPQAAPLPVAAPPAEAPIKMEGAAGTGDSPFQAGAVSNEYRGGAPVVGSPGGGTAPNVVDRAQQRLYAQATRQQLQAELERRMRGDASEQVVDFSLWLQADGSIERWDLRPSGDAQADSELGAVLDGAAPGLRFAPPPAGLVQPLRFRLNVRPAG